MRLSGAAAVLALSSVAAPAGLVLNQAILDITAAAPTAQDIEVWNDSGDVAYVVAEPSEILAPGTPSEKRVRVVDPAVGGLLVSPQKLILQPGERKLVRVAAVAERPVRDRIYRVTIKPVAGSVSASGSALKLLVGYDALVIYRPLAPAPDIVATRSGTTLTLANYGNTNAELFEGEVCPAPDATKACAKLPPRRLYAGADWTQTLPAAGAVSYHVTTGALSSTLRF